MRRRRETKPAAIHRQSGIRLSSRARGVATGPAVGDVARADCRRSPAPGGWHRPRLPAAAPGRRRRHRRSRQPANRPTGQPANRPTGQPANRPGARRRCRAPHPRRRCPIAPKARRRNPHPFTRPATR
ncbi:PT domain-containing protein [Streptomyces sp. NPDC056669]|uniref:PT domain-containing protein n=1 Tax=Streptomyces sp. NPDC056669 TaxID=3345903 RepID=UPI003688B426